MLLKSLLFRRPNSRRARVVRAIAQDSKRGFWALADQGIVSLGNFGLNIVLARDFSNHHTLQIYGAFWVFMELMFFLNGIHGALLVYPVTVRGATHDEKALRRMAGQSLMLTMLATPILMLCMIVTAALAQQPLMVGFWAGLALLFWQMQEIVRRALMAHLRFRAACSGDAISYIGQFGAVALLAHWDALTLAGTFQAIALTSALACVAQVLQLGLNRTTRRATIAFAHEAWRVGRWILFGNLSNVCSGALFNWNFAYWAGLEVLGVYYALINLIKPANPLAFAVGTLITPTAAKAYAAEGLDRARRMSARLGLLGAALLAPYLAVLLIFPKASLAIFYGWSSEYLQHWFLVQVAAVAVAFIYLGTATGAFLNGIDRARESCIGQMSNAGAYLLLVLPVTAIYGLRGAVLGWLAASAIRVIVNFYFVFQSDAPSVTAHPSAGTAG